MRELIGQNIGDYLQIGVLTGTYGVKGEMKLIPLTDHPERFDGLHEAQLEKDGKVFDIRIDECRMSKNGFIIMISGINDMEQAALLKGCFISVHRDKAVNLAEGEYFICDIINCDVYDRQAGYIGKVADVLKTGSNDVYVVRNGDTGREILIPALKSVVEEVAVTKKKIKVSLPEGLVD